MTRAFARTSFWMRLVRALRTPVRTRTRPLRTQPRPWPVVPQGPRLTAPLRRMVPLRRAVPRKPRALHRLVATRLLFPLALALLRLTPRLRAPVSLDPPLARLLASSHQETLHHMSVLVWLLYSPSLASPLLFEHVRNSRDRTLQRTMPQQFRDGQFTGLSCLLYIVLSAANIYHCVVLLSHVMSLRRRVDHPNRR